MKGAFLILLDCPPTTDERVSQLVATVERVRSPRQAMSCAEASESLG